MASPPKAPAIPYLSDPTQLSRHGHIYNNKRSSNTMPSDPTQLSKHGLSIITKAPAIPYLSDPTQLSRHGHIYNNKCSSNTMPSDPTQLSKHGLSIITKAPAINECTGTSIRFDAKAFSRLPIKQSKHCHNGYPCKDPRKPGTYLDFPTQSNRLAHIYIFSNAKQRPGIFSEPRHIKNAWPLWQSHANNKRLASYQSQGT